MHIDQEVLSPLPQEGCISGVRSVTLSTSTCDDPAPSNSIEDIEDSYLPQ